MTFIIFILIYLVSLVIHLIVCYRENKYAIFKVGDIIDLIEFYMWFPVINTFFLIVFVLCFIVYTIFKLLKIDVLWEKFRNIKLK